MSDTVALIHGLGRSGMSMRAIARACRRAGHMPLSVGYPSWRQDAQTAAPNVAGAIARAIAAPPRGGRVHVIAHSMGCLVTLFAIEILLHGDARAIDGLGRLVMLAPPFGGSAMADLAYRIAPLRHVLGPALARLRHGATGIDRTVALPVQAGIIAGSRSLVPGLDRMFGGGHDGRVAVAATRHGGATDHIVLPVDHGLMLLSHRVQAAALAFIADGRFPRSSR